MPRFRIHRLVDFEFGEVWTWYAVHSPVAAENFVHRFLAALEHVQRHPTAQTLWRPPFRRIRLARYPYLVIFHTDRRYTSVIALVHERREPTRTLGPLTDRLKNFR